MYIHMNHHNIKYVIKHYYKMAEYEYCLFLIVLIEFQTYRHDLGKIYIFYYCICINFMNDFW